MACAGTSNRAWIREDGSGRAGVRRLSVRAPTAAGRGGDRAAPDLTLVSGRGGA
jgi:hypothetical protein